MIYILYTVYYRTCDSLPSAKDKTTAIYKHYIETLSARINAKAKETDADNENVKNGENVPEQTDDSTTDGIMAKDDTELDESKKFDAVYSSIIIEPPPKQPALVEALNNFEELLESFRQGEVVADDDSMIQEPLKGKKGRKGKKGNTSIQSKKEPPNKVNEENTPAPSEGTGTASGPVSRGMTAALDSIHVSTIL